MGILDINQINYGHLPKNFIPNILLLFLKVPIMTGQVMRPLLVYDIEITYHKRVSIFICLILFKSDYKLLEYILKV